MFQLPLTNRYNKWNNYNNRRHDALNSDNFAKWQYLKILQVQASLIRLFTNDRLETKVLMRNTTIKLLSSYGNSTIRGFLH